MHKTQKNRFIDVRLNTHQTWFSCVLIPALKMKINSYMKAQVAVKAVHINRMVLMAFLSLGEDPVINSSHSAVMTFIQIYD